MNQETELAELGEGVYVDAEALIEGRLLVQASSGGGKSYAIRKLCEILYGAAQIIVIDVEGEFFTLRERDDYVLFGPTGDYPATVKSAGLMARRLLELGTSAVIDIYELGAQRAVFIARFIEAIMAAPRELWHDLIIVVDEANKYAPEGGQRDKMTEDSANAIVDLMTRGRKRGYCGILATQRLSALDKNAAAECINALIGSCNLDVDIARAAKKLGMKPAQAGEILPELAKGQFYVMGPAITTDWSVNRVTKIKVGQVVTNHPKRGQKVAVSPPAATIRKVLGQLKDLEEAAAIELDTIEGANKQVAYWMGEYQRLKNVASTKTAEINEHFAHEFRDALRQTRDELEDVKKERDALRAGSERVMAAFGNVPFELRKIADRMVNAFPPSVEQVIATGLAKASPTPHKTPARIRNIDDVVHSERPKPLTSAQAKALIKDAESAAKSPGWSITLAPAQQRILDTMRLLERLQIDYDPITFGAYYGKHPRNKALLNNLGILRSSGLVEEWALTDAGRRRAVVMAMPSQNELRRQILAPISPAQRRIVDALLERAYDTTEELSAALGIHVRNKAFLNNLGTLRSRHLVTKGRPVQAGRVLFMDGA